MLIKYSFFLVKIIWQCNVRMLISAFLWFLCTICIPNNTKSIVSFLFVIFQNVVTLGHETINTPLYCQLDGRQCHLATDRLCRYVLVGESEDEGGWAIKSLTLAAFAPSLYSAVDYNIRVYCVEDTRAALQVRYILVVVL